jgi:membrane protein required for colicin V production
MSIFDISLLIILAGFVISGLFKGLIRMLGQIVGLFAAAYVASHFYLAFYDWWKNWAWWQEWALAHASPAKIISFIVLFVLVVYLIDLAFLIIEKVFKLIAIIPGSRFLNNILGAALGFLRGALFLGLILYVISRYVPLNGYWSDQLSNSFVVPLLLKITHLVLPLLPEALKALQAII